MYIYILFYVSMVDAFYDTETITSFVSTTVSTGALEFFSFRILNHPS